MIRVNKLYKLSKEHMIYCSFVHFINREGEKHASKKSKGFGGIA